MHAQGLTTGGTNGWYCVAGLRWLLLTGVFLLLPASLPADDARGAFTVAEARIVKGEDAYLLDARLDVTLSSGAQEAMENGIPLVFELQVQVLERHFWLWDKVVAERKEIRQVQLHALSRTYVVKDIGSGGQRSFHDLGDALLLAGMIRNLHLLDADRLETGKRYSVRLRGGLDIESLPTPVRAIAYVSSAWDMDSEWYLWQLAQ